MGRHLGIDREEFLSYTGLEALGGISAKQFSQILGPTQHFFDEIGEGAIRLA
ncbi:hypothetical protein SAMN04488087_2050 [Rhodothermus profundi]|uniref:Uncharacterized protein n=1 Tax=Rhodothermus profundi TaxID=633813 RepID=A0A1M6VJ23_9BACT|nr:hypothetical protein SAMN04488087_2050 [Rhodothermus profundi]